MLTDSYGYISYQSNGRANIKNQKISELLKTSDQGVSMEICPNRGINEELLCKLNTHFCSITWRKALESDMGDAKCLPAVSFAQQLMGQGHNVLLHLAGRNLRRSRVIKILRDVKNIGIKNIFALQGDPLEIVEKDDLKCDFPYAADLVKFIKLNFGNHFCIGVAGYPEKHPASEDVELDMKYLKEKVTCGADFIITQASYEFEAFEKFSLKCKEYDINIPIIPGLFIISSYKSLIAMSSFCGVPVSANIMRIVNDIKDNNDAVREFGIHRTTDLIKRIFNSRHLFNGIHIFSLNNLELVNDVMSRLGLLKSNIEYPMDSKHEIST